MDEQEARQILDGFVKRVKNIDFAELQGEYLDAPQYITVRSQSKGMYKVCIGAEPEGENLKAAVTVDALDDEENAFFRLLHFFVISPDGEILTENESKEIIQNASGG